MDMKQARVYTRIHAFDKHGGGDCFDADRTNFSPLQTKLIIALRKQHKNVDCDDPPIGSRQFQTKFMDSCLADRPT